MVDSVYTSIPEMVTIAEASQRTGLSYHCLRKLCLDKKIVFFRAGTKFLINWGKLVEFLNNVIGEETTKGKEEEEGEYL